ncbi:MAG: 2-oxoglutarate dehydrogenase complex dihydrolipoyllysine-residue succinyltransferase [Chloroflexota bacterium]
MVDIVVPPLSESVVEATVAEWLKNVGDSVDTGDVLVVLETDKVALEVTAEQSGVLSEIVAGEEEDVVAGQLLAKLKSNGSAVASSAPTPQASSEHVASPEPTATAPASNNGIKATPVAQRMASEHGIDLSQVPANGKIDKADVQAYIDGKSQAPATASPTPAPKPASKPAKADVVQRDLRDDEDRNKMSRMRRTIAKNLVHAQQTAAMLTTFQEVDMGAVMELRSRRKAAFKEKYGVSLGVNSFFVKAVVGALKAFPRLNAEIEGDYVIDKYYYDIGIAVGSDEGLVVPVLRDADRLSFSAIEQQIKSYALQVRDNTLPIEALRGGSFTITNGGVFGSLMSTPILNYPQVGILGLHGIKDRPVVVDGEIVIRPWMYMALTYDHRIVDGSSAVRFLVKIKDLIEDPETLLIEG